MVMQLADLRAVGEARTKLGIPDDTEATPAQTLELLRLVPQDVAERLVSSWQDRAREGIDCWMRNHAAEIRYLREQLLTARTSLPPSSRAVTESGK